MVTSPQGARARRAGRRAAVVAAAALALLLPASPAAADAPAPTDYRSEVVRVVGVDGAPVGGVEARVVGGDSFLALAVEPGTTVVVSDYRGNPYVRVAADGTVSENQRSEATYLNASRDGGVRPADFQAGPPRWEVVAHGGTWAWHDHRIHDMRATPTAALRQGGSQPWEVDLSVDGAPARIEGRYRLLDPPALWPSLLVAAAALALVVGAGLMRGGRPAYTDTALVALLAAAVLAVVVGWNQVQEIPPGAGNRPLEVALPVVAAVSGVLGLLSRDRRRRLVGALAAAAMLGSWVIERVAVLTHAVLPTPLDPAVDRLGTAVVLGVSLGAAYLGVASGDLTRADLGSAPEREPGPELQTEQKGPNDP